MNWTPLNEKPTLAERLVDAIGEALGVDTGTIAESRMDRALTAAQKILNAEADRRAAVQKAKTRRRSGLTRDERAVETADRREAARAKKA